MTKPLKMTLDLETFEILADAADGRGKFCKVEKNDLLSLIMDHGRALGALQDAGVEIEMEDDDA